MTMFNITDGKNNISRDKPVEHIDLVIGLMVSGCLPALPALAHTYIHTYMSGCSPACGPGSVGHLVYLV